MRILQIITDAFNQITDKTGEKKPQAPEMSSWLPKFDATGEDFIELLCTTHFLRS